MPFAYRNAALIVGLGLGVSLALGGAALAQERGTAEAREACTPDVFRLCGEFIPDAERITLCLARRRPDLNPACRRIISADEPAAARSPGRARRRVRVGREGS